MSELAVALHFGPGIKEAGLSARVIKYGPLFDALEACGQEEGGVQPIITLGQEAYDLPQSTTTPVAKKYYTVERQADGSRVVARVSGELSVPVGAALDTSGGFARYVNDTRVLNPVGIRDLCLDNLDIYETLKEYFPPSLPLKDAESRADLGEWLAEATGDTVIVKEATSRQGKGVTPVSRNLKDVQAIVGTDPAKRFLIQQAVACAPTFAGLRDKAPDKGVLAEHTDEFQLRAHMIDEDGFYIGRSFPDDKHDDEYISLVQASVPRDVDERIKMAMRTLRQEVDATHSYVAADSVVDVQTGIRYIIDVNGAWPEFVPNEPGRGIDRRVLGRRLAHKLFTMAVV